MKLRHLSCLAITSIVLSSCIYYTQPVPEMPYGRPNVPNSAAVPPSNAAYAAAAQYEGTWTTTQPSVLPTATPYSAAPYTANLYTPGTSQPPPLTPLPATIPVTTPAAPSTAITQPRLNPPAVTPAPAPVVKPAVAAAPAAAAKITTPAPAAAKDPKTITNNGPIPVATPVPGDPTRVYNPLDSSKTIRITDKNGKIYPSGKELKVRGTNFHFYVP